MLPEVKPDKQMLGEGKSSAGETLMFIKPCHSVSEGLPKKMRVDTTGVEGLDLPPTKIELGQPLDIKALLSTKHRDYLLSPKDPDARVPISSLHAKYVLVCGFAVPVERPSSRVASELRAIEALYTELSRRGIADDVKLVIVVKPSPGFTVTEADLRTFFTRITVNCLTVPLSDSQSLHFLYKSLGYIPYNPSFDLLPHLVLNPSGIVLQHCSDFLLHYGPLSFPFTLEHFHIVGMEDKILEHQLYFSYEPRTVKRLLGCEKLSEIGNEMKSKSTDELDNTPVGIYLYFGGEFMEELQDIHQKCVEKGLKFEIVLVPMPFDSESDPASFYELMKQHALKYSTTSSWLAFPFDDKICRSLWHISMLRTNDQLIILQHDNWCGELFGKKVVSYYGIDAYPFNRKVVVEKKFSELRSLTADSLLSFTDDAPTKHVLLQIDYAERGNTYIRNKLPHSVGTFTELKGKYPDIVDIFIPIRSSIRKPISFDEEDQAEVMDLIFMKGTYVEEPVRPLVVVFGEDGKIVSRHEDGNLRGSTTPANLFNDTLRAEILYDLRDKIDNIL